MKSIRLLFFIISFITCLLHNHAYTQSLALDWVVASGTRNFDASKCVVIDNSGNIYESGYFYGDIDLDPGDSTHIIHSNSKDIYLRKLTPDGKLIWAKGLNLSVNGESHDIDFDAEGNIVLVGRRAAKGTIFKITPDGEILWNKTLEGYGGSIALSAVCSPDNNDIYITGYFNSKVDFDPGAGEHMVTATGYTGQIPHYHDGYLLCLDTSGNFKWVKKFGGNNSDIAREIAIDATGNLGITGWFTSTADFNPDLGTYNLYSSGVDDMFMLKLSPTGDFLWARKVGSYSNDSGVAIAVDETNSWYVTGFVHKNDVLIVKYDANGTTQWLKQLNGSYAQGMDMVYKDDIYIAGFFNDKLYLNNSTGGSFLESKGGSDSFFLSINKQGNILMAKSFGGPGNDEVRGIDALNEEIVVTGSYEELANFNINSSLYQIESVGSSDLFVSKFGQCYHSPVTEVYLEACNKYLSANGQVFTESGVYADAMRNSTGCDSLLTLHLTILKSPEYHYEVTACHSYIPPYKTTPYTKSGNYIDSLSSSNGCDSLIYLNLIINEPTSSDTEIVSCESYVTPLGNVVESSGIYQETLQNSQACDSILTMNITILESAYSSISLSSCEPIVSPSGSEVYYETGIYTDTLVSSLGCDSVVTVSLTIYETSLDSIQVASCNNIFSPGGGEVYYETGIYTDILKNRMGCDSIIVVNYQRIHEYEDIYVPNVITPNGDGYNDMFVLDDRLIESQLHIYNRWGKQVYQSDNYSNNWQGAGLASGTYFYTLRDTQCNQDYKGHITVIK